jgi:hypothetical protein
MLTDDHYPASLRDAVGRVLCAGEARFCIKDGRGVFWPQGPAVADAILKNAVTVQTSQGHKFKIRNVELCFEDLPQDVHFDFDCEFQSVLEVLESSGFSSIGGFSV